MGVEVDGDRVEVGPVTEAGESDGERPVPPLRAAEMTDRFRRGMLTLARETKRADMGWLRETIAELEREIAQGAP